MNVEPNERAVIGSNSTGMEFGPTADALAASRYNTTLRSVLTSIEHCSLTPLTVANLGSLPPERYRILAENSIAIGNFVIARGLPRRDLDGGERVRGSTVAGLLLHLVWAFSRNKDGHVVMSLNQLADMIGCRKGTVLDACNFLIDCGLIRVVGVLGKNKRLSPMGSIFVGSKNLLEILQDIGGNETDRRQPLVRVGTFLPTNSKNPVGTPKRTISKDTLPDGTPERTNSRSETGYKTPDGTPERTNSLVSPVSPKATRAPTHARAGLTVTQEEEDPGIREEGEDWEPEVIQAPEEDGGFHAPLPAPVSFDDYTGEIETEPCSHRACACVDACVCAGVQARAGQPEVLVGEIVSPDAGRPKPTVIAASTSVTVTEAPDVSTGGFDLGDSIALDPAAIEATLRKLGVAAPTPAHRHKVGDTLTKAALQWQGMDIDAKGRKHTRYKSLAAWVTAEWLPNLRADLEKITANPVAIAGPAVNAGLAALFAKQKAIMIGPMRNVSGDECRVAYDDLPDGVKAMAITSADFIRVAGILGDAHSGEKVEGNVPHMISSTLLDLVVQRERGPIEKHVPGKLWRKTTWLAISEATRDAVIDRLVHALEADLAANPDGNQSSGWNGSIAEQFKSGEAMRRWLLNDKYAIERTHPLVRAWQWLKDFLEAWPDLRKEDYGTAEYHSRCDRMFRDFATGSDWATTQLVRMHRVMAIDGRVHDEIGVWGIVERAKSVEAAKGRAA